METARTLFRRDLCYGGVHFVTHEHATQHVIIQTLI